MTLLAQILRWSKEELKPWQSDAVRRLFLQGDLSSQDFDDLYAMLKSSHAIEDEQGRTPVPLSEEHIPETSSNAVPAVLLTMKDLENVNRITRQQALSFEISGLTVIYGDNGSGKSGYARVLKHACRARTKGEPVLPNAGLAQDKQGTPSATFEVLLAGERTPVHWTYGASPPVELSTVAVFDSHCARAYVGSEGDLIFMPWGLDVVENLASVVFKELERRLNGELHAIDTSSTPFSDLAGTTKVGQLLDKLGPRTKPADIESLATLTEEEKAQLVSLEKTFAEADPKAKAEALRRDSRRLDGIRTTIALAVNWVDGPACQKLKTLDDLVLAATQAERLAAQELRAGEDQLPGTGEAVWKELFQAARRFSEEHAYEGRPFPVVDGDAVCPLCQQRLDTGAAHRLHRFEDYLKHDTARVAGERREARASAVSSLADAKLGFSLERATVEWLTEKDPELAAAIAAFETSLESRRQAVLAALDSRDWDGLPAIAEDPRERLQKLAETMVQEAHALESTLDVERRNTMALERAELRARQALGPRKAALESLVGRMKTKHALEACRYDLKTKPVSDKVRALTSGTVTPALSRALNDEFSNLGVAHLKTRLRDRVEQGKPKYELVLEFPGSVEPERILSEGEQRAIAIASFLAELGQSRHKGPAVFDDPVSSLDHWRRQRLAKRLVSEAKVRQLVVFTHDTVFLAEIKDALLEQGVAHMYWYLNATADEAGYVNDGLPWHHMSHADRLDKLDKAQRTLEKAQGKIRIDDLDSIIRNKYGQLRQVVERVVQDVVFCGVIQRYNDHIRVSNLRNVVGLTAEECDRIIRAC